MTPCTTFLRQFDLGFACLEAGANGEEVTGMSRTRTAKTFMLLAGAAGIFG
ncbi:hypothetical protein [Hasllibacter halocynthiae]|uniref:hypothetical protein n=1 Tax=Hasllibacter halocynthiae TaxID=595589 RepID=UPI001304F38A|nr:hypothetical protein [Hasllibacter halocynthiae]